MKALQSSRAYMDQITVEQRIHLALKSNIPPCYRYLLKPGNLVRVYREQSKRWIGPAQVIKVELKLVLLTDGVKEKQFNAAQVMPIETGHPETEEDLDRIFIQQSNENGVPGALPGIW